jgi:hypothetical protein
MKARAMFMRAAWVMSCLLIAGCIFQDDERSAKRGSEVENQVYGVLVDANGLPVKGAKVKALPAATALVKGAAAAPQADSALTDDEGRYGFDSLGGGRYNVAGDYQAGALVMLHPDVAVNDTGTVDVGTDTLRAPGSVSGRLLQGLQGKGGVLCYVPGTSYLAVSDDSGRFTLGLPQGVYTLDYSTAGFIVTPDSGVAVLSGRRTRLSDKHIAYDPALPPPAPQGLKAVYDTLNERVILTWNEVPVSDLQGYVVYRDDSTSLQPVIVPNGFTTATRFVDTAIGAVPSGTKRTLTYRIKSRDVETNVSAVFSPPVSIEAVSRKLVTTLGAISAPAAPDFNVSVGDSIDLILDFSNPTRRITRIVWHEGDSSADPVKVRDLSLLAGSDTLRFRAGGPGETKFFLQILDESGAVEDEIAKVNVVQDVPVAHAGSDLKISVHDVVHLAGKAEQKFGRIVKWEWDLGATGVFRATAGGDTSFMIPDGKLGLYPCVLRVTDDDSNVAVDTVRVTVTLDKPFAYAGLDTTVSLGDAVHLHGYGRDGLGYVANREWDFGGTGNFRSSSTGDTVITAPTDKAGPYPCVWRVTDDDGLQSLDTVLITVLQDPPVAMAKASQIGIFAGDTVTLSTLGTRDGFGRIVKWEWDIGGKGAYRAASGADTVITAPVQADTNMPCRLRVTDDDGQTAVAEIPLRVFPRDRWIKVKDDEPYAGWGTSFLGVTFGGRAVLAPFPVPDPSPHQIWVSGNMMDWDSLVIDIPDGGWQSPLIVMGGKIWGFLSNTQEPAKLELWSTADGTHWSQSPLPKALDYRRGFAAFAFKGSLWILGGLTERTDTSLAEQMQKDIWHSTDGVTWKRETPASGPLSRLCYGIIPAVTEMGGKVWLYGGLPDNLASTILNDVWSSDDGIAWTKVTSQALPKPRTNATLLSFGGKLRLIGGDDNVSINLKDTWNSTDGTNWTKDPATPPPSFKEYQSYMEFQGSMWMFGGTNPDTHLDGGEIWKAPWQ